uniref:Uncharacterized protein n=1 Tax=Candidatus Kentrum sp. LPFa TaxID=2126335 RepID=A0A450XVH1_9GAMM|nr:MAG: hypothetical protein BECKLPF1236A_GA0070988_102045 [Candidatus Kentron sp. LPFa]VFK33266.1 MAG: hypothetical protein BECKLPF1236C_GA0070990_101996 [Candidatus Kentron sp. LPFa]
MTFSSYQMPTCLVPIAGISNAASPMVCTEPRRYTLPDAGRDVFTRDHALASFDDVSIGKECPAHAGDSVSDDILDLVRTLPTIVDERCRLHLLRGRGVAPIRVAGPHARWLGKAAMASTTAARPVPGSMPATKTAAQQPIKTLQLLLAGMAWGAIYRNHHFIPVTSLFLLEWPKSSI